MFGIRILLFIQLLTLAVFFLFKLSRDQLLAVASNSIVTTILYSFPNFAEAIIGSMTVAMALLMANERFLNRGLSPHLIYALSILSAGAYVLSQELKIHNLGGNNIFDPMDVLFSICGLICSLVLLLFLRPRIEGRPR